MIPKQGFLSWTTVKTFTTEDVAVRVKCLPLYHPRFSYEIGSVHPSTGRFRPYIQPPLEVENYKPTLQRQAYLISELVEKAEDYIMETALKAEEDNKLERASF